jgi:hypothetical protein
MAHGFFSVSLAACLTVVPSVPGFPPPAKGLPEVVAPVEPPGLYWVGSPPVPLPVPGLWGSQSGLAPQGLGGAPAVDRPVGSALDTGSSWA